MRLSLGLLAALFAVVAAPAFSAETQPPVTILVSIDAFRADYAQRGLTPNLAALARDGISAVMRPSFPTKTYPNHYAIVTGLRPDRNGIVGNRIEDAARPGEIFTTKNDADAFWWAEAEPIWTAVEKAGQRSAIMFWPGSRAAFDGIRPRDWGVYDENITSAQRVDAVVDWLRRPVSTRPRFIALYLDRVDKAGHRFGPASPELDAALIEVDQQLGRLRGALAAMHLPANLIVVSDHGMAAISPDRVLRLSAIADPADYHVVEDGSIATLDPLPGRDAALAASLLKPHAHVACYRKADLPEHLHYGRNPRVTAFVCLADVGWMLMDVIPKWGLDRGTHGYDNRAPEMQAYFAAAGPDIRRAGHLPPFDNVDLYPLLRRLVGLPPKAAIDGSIAPFTKALKSR
ncbi:MAG TPA: ectonucleotide pyrophosphatase/phosphodiesterase [Sphingomonas sp.]|nr:ectonucleotide pyrophosphatase/phosphodiesterase [Sphingomonas sp.]